MQTSDVLTIESTFSSRAPSCIEPQLCGARAVRLAVLSNGVDGENHHIPTHLARAGDEDSRRSSAARQSEERRWQSLERQRKYN